MVTRLTKRHEKPSTNGVAPRSRNRAGGAGVKHVGVIGRQSLQGEFIHEVREYMDTQLVTDTFVADAIT